MPKSVVVAVRDIPRITNQLKIEKMELKFKAQRKHNSENVYFNLKYFLENDEATIPDAFQYVLKNIRQYSGFKDRNGTEIYEGDIFIYNYTLDGTQRKTKKVEFDKEVGAWYLGVDLLSTVLVEQNNDDWKKSQNYKIKENQYLIISGNIYDNPNLLQ